MKKILILGIFSLFLIFGCVNQPNVNDPNNPFNQPPINQPPIEEEPPQPLPPQLPEPDPVQAVDQCAWTHDIKNFEFERNPSDAQSRALRNCYNDTYILKITPQTTVSFCGGITDSEFLVECYKSVARKSSDLSACGQAPAQTNYVKEVLETVSISDACYYRYLESFSHDMTDEQKTFACTSVVNERLNKYCFDRIEFFSNQ